MMAIADLIGSSARFKAVLDDTYGSLPGRTAPF